MIFKNAIISVKNLNSDLRSKNCSQGTIFLICIISFFINFIIDCVLLYVGYHIGKYIINLF